MPLAPLHQPHNLAPIRVAARAPARAAAGRLLRHRVPPHAIPSRAGVRAARRAARRGRAPLRLPRPVVRVHRLGAAASYDARAAARQDRRAATSATARACARCRPAGASRARWASPRSTACRWARAAARSTPASALPHGRARDGRARDREAASTASRACSACPASRATCASCSTRADPRAKLAVDLFVYRIGRELGSLAAALGGLDALVFTAASARTAPAIRERVCRDAAWLGVELDAAANADERAAHQRGGQPRAPPGSSRPTRN